MKILCLFFFFLFNLMIYPFPGDHNSLTCIDHLFYDKNSSGIVFYDAQAKKDYYDQLAVIASPTKSDTDKANARQIINGILAGIQSRKDFLTSSPDVKTHIKSSHDLPLDMTIWGDSLSDFVDFYGAVPFSYFGTPYPTADYGNEPGFIDSFGDYFTIFGKSTSNPFGIKNYAEAGNTSYGLLGKVNITLDGQREVDPTGSHCIPPDGRASSVFRGESFNGKSALRSTVMVGGNDVLQMVHGNWMPFINRYAVDMTLENIGLFVDWNIENGKEVFLLGTIPVYSEPIQPYNNLLINRKTLCGSVDDLLIEPADVPWWVCALNPGICTSIVKRIIDYNEQTLKDIKTFYHNLNKAPIAGGGEFKALNAPLSIASINQACINDRIQDDFGPIYSAVYPSHVKFSALYNEFAVSGGNGLASSYWTPIRSTYLKMDGTLFDPIHIGPNGYRLWAEKIVPRLLTLGWNRTPSESEIPDPVIDLSNDGPGKKIRQKALASSLQGKEATGSNVRVPSLIENSQTGSGIYGGYYRDYKVNNATIYLKQIKGNEPLASNESRYGEPHLLAGSTIPAKYREIGGPGSPMGFPISDVYLTHFDTIYRADFECGRIENNILDLITPTYVIYNNPKPAGCK